MAINNKHKKKSTTLPFGIRKNQLLGPYGVGAIMPCPGGDSVMISGLDAFPIGTMEEVADPRLAKYIGVKRILSPTEKSLIPSSRFPGWMYCPICRKMQKVAPNKQDKPRCSNNKCKGFGYQLLIPERFIVVCPEGHVDDVPLIEWVHEGPVSNPDEHELTRSTSGGNATLSDIKYTCSCGKKRTLKGITRKGALSDVGYECKGSRPWLWSPDPDGCKAEQGTTMVVQRGGTNVWYSDVVSSIYVPSGVSKAVLKKVESKIDKLSSAAEKGAEFFDFVLDAIADECGCDVSEVVKAYYQIKEATNKESSSEGDYRMEEFSVLSEGTLFEPGVFEGSPESLDSYSSEYLKSIVSEITLVSTLQETRALVGFSRLLPDHNEELKFSTRRKQLSVNYLDWTLGIQSTGEGIFLEFNREVLSNWLSRESVKQRVCLMQKLHEESCKRHDKKIEEINPYYVLIHTLSHVLMLSLSKVCGYSTASIRERIYCDKFIKEGDTHEDMLGLMIYTSSTDSEGSLGGLVRAGRPGRFETIFDKAINDAKWCSSDPVCIGSQGQGPDSCNLAACYSCSLVPETSCENGNRFLDRALLIGKLDDSSVGLFGVDCDSMETGALKELPNVGSISLSKEGFDDLSSIKAACEMAQEDAESDVERSFLESLENVDNSDEIEIPCYFKTFNFGDSCLDASLVWRDKKVAVFLGDCASDFIDEFGIANATIKGWELYADVSAIDISDFVAKLRG